jgi:hypothetical protein
MLRSLVFTVGLQKFFILVVIDGLGPKDMHAFSFFSKVLCTVQPSCSMYTSTRLQQPSSRMWQMPSMAKTIGYELLNNISYSST